MRIDDVLLEKLNALPESRVKDAMIYSSMAGGKRIRPNFLYEVLKGYGMEESAGDAFAAAIEMIQTYSLIHDDLPAMDNDDLRRGKPTCHKQFDEATAILAGDGLLTYAFETAAASPCQPERVTKSNRHPGRNVRSIRHGIRSELRHGE
jgi:geranylgeranyl pyrophosphate synthase